MMSSVKRMSPSGVRVMGCFFVVSALMLLSCLTMGMRMVFLSFLVVLGCLLRHDSSSVRVFRL